MPKNKLLNYHVWGWLVVVSAVLFLSLFYFQKQYFLTSDLGRHLKNGEYILTTRKVPTTNLYSYTETDFPAPNHHWAAGVIYYLVKSCCGFEGLQLFSIGTYLLAILMAVTIAAKKSQPLMVATVLMMALPFIVWRNEIRPEAFSYVLLMTYVLIILRVKSQEIKMRWLWLLPILQIAWINLHVFFVIGVGLVGLAWMDELVQKKLAVKKTLRWFGLLVITAAVNLFNPFGWVGLLAPLSVESQNLANVTETQTVFELLKHFDRTDYVEFVIVVMASWYVVYRLVKKHKVKSYLFEVALILIFGVLGGWMVRNMAMFGLVLVAVGPRMVEEVISSRLQATSKKTQIIMTGLILGVILLGLREDDWLYSPFKTWEEFGLGIRSGETKPAEFIKETGIKGPWYNNFDIGGYLIYYFYPDEKVFIDNRPEAYSPEFFKGDYIQMHQDENKWGEIANKYQFNAIIADYQDNTSWLRPFLQRRYRDSMWALVYQDQNVVILLRKDAQNQNIIDKYEITDTEK